MSLGRSKTQGMYAIPVQVAREATDEGEGLGELLPADHLARCRCSRDTECGVGTVWGEASRLEGGLRDYMYTEMPDQELGSA